MNLLLLNSFDKIVNCQHVKNSIIQSLVVISPLTSPSAASGKASKARPWWELPYTKVSSATRKTPFCILYVFDTGRIVERV